MNEATVIYWTCSAFGWVAFGYRLRDLRRAPRNPMRWAVSATLFFGAAAVTSAAPAAIAFINRVSGVPNLAAPLVYSLLLALSASAHVMLAYWRHPPERARRTARRWMLVYGLLIACLVVLFMMGDTPVERRVDFDTYYATTPYTVEFVLLYLLALATAMVGQIWMCWRWAGVAGRPWLRRGLRLIVAGAVGALCFSIAKTVAVAARWFGADWDGLSTHVAPAFATLGLVISAVGYALPAWGEYLTRMRGRADRYHAYRDLYPLWDALRRATPAIVPPARIPWWDLELRLTRRLAEINDGRLALRSHIDPHITAAALRLGRDAGLTGADLHAVVDAARLRTAMAAKAANHRFPQDAPGAQDTGTGQHGALGGADGVGELAWLVRVSRAFADSPVVASAAARAEVDDRPGDGGRTPVPERAPVRSRTKNRVKKR